MGRWTDGQMDRYVDTRGIELLSYIDGTNKNGLEGKKGWNGEFGAVTVDALTRSLIHSTPSLVLTLTHSRSSSGSSTCSSKEQRAWNRNRKRKRNTGVWIQDSGLGFGVWSSFSSCCVRVVVVCSRARVHPCTYVCMYVPVECVYE